MSEWWELLSGAEKVYWAISIVFSVLFIIQFVLSLIGLDADTEFDVEIETDMDIDIDANSAPNIDLDPGYGLDADFTIFSFRSLIAFFTFFGWTGVLSLRDGLSVPVATTLAVLAGAAAMFIVAYMMFKFSQLDSTGTYNILHAIENKGKVYLTIPEKLAGTGLIHIKLDGVLRELPATTNGKALPTGSAIKVIDVLENNILLVEPMALLESPQSSS